MKNQFTRETVIRVTAPWVKIEIFRIWGKEGHRQKQSFGESEKLDFSTTKETRVIEIRREDTTFTNEYVLIAIARDSEEDCYKELNSQLNDGIFENCNFGKIERYTKKGYEEIFFDSSGKVQKA